MTAPAASLVLMSATHTEVHRWIFRDQTRANACAAAMSTALRNGAPRLPLFDDDPRCPPCYLDAKGIAYVRVIYHVPGTMTHVARPIALRVPQIDHQARASGDRED